jgi:hypothetical protein
VVTRPPRLLTIPLSRPALFNEVPPPACGGDPDAFTDAALRLLTG